MTDTSRNPIATLTAASSDQPVEIHLSNGLIALVDADDLPLVSNYQWYGKRGRTTYYAVAYVRGSGKKHGKKVRMHRLILGAPDGVFVDHIDGNGLNNRHSNLRLASPQENEANSRGKGGTSCYKGVYRHADGGWAAQIKVNRRSRHLGLFRTEEDAAWAYDRAAVLYFGTFARLNFPR